MPSLEALQSMMMRSLDDGPKHLEYDLFSGSPARVLIGMKVHANTISHARLIALEETFPRTCEAMGHERFNALSRDYVEWPSVPELPLAQIGALFAAYLDGVGEAQSSGLVRFEWDWLQAYHAADAQPLALADLAGIDEEELLSIELTRHPAAHISHYGDYAHRILDREVLNAASAYALLLVRPEADVLVSPATAAMAMLLPMFKKSVTIGNLFTAANEHRGKDKLSPDDIMPALLALIDAGALLRGKWNEGNIGIV